MEKRFVDFEEKIQKNKFNLKLLKITLVSLFLLLSIFSIIQIFVCNVFTLSIYLLILTSVCGIWFLFNYFDEIVEHCLLLQELKMIYSEISDNCFSEKINGVFVEEKSFFLNIKGYYCSIDRFSNQVYVSKDSTIDKHSYYNICQSCVNPDILIAVCTKKHPKLNILNEIKIQNFVQGTK